MLHLKFNWSFAKCLKIAIRKFGNFYRGIAKIINWNLKLFCENGSLALGCGFRKHFLGNKK
jgi:hypothetical protein